MLMTKRWPATVGEILVQKFMEPMGLTRSALAEAMGVQRKHVNELCNDRRTVTVPTAIILCTRVRQQSRLLAQRPMSKPTSGTQCTRRANASGAPALSERLREADAPRSLQGSRRQSRLAWEEPA